MVLSVALVDAMIKDSDVVAVRSSVSYEHWTLEGSRFSEQYTTSC